MKNILITLCLLLSFNTIAQSPEALGKQKFFKGLYEDLLKYSTIYGAGDVSNSIEAKDNVFFVRTGESGSLYDIPVVVDATPDYPFDYRYGFGIRKLARFSYERKPKNFYDGTEEQLAFRAPTSAFKGLEYQFHFEKERFRGETYENHRNFIKHTGKYHIIKAETRKVGKINLKYQSAEIRARLPIGDKFSISAGAIYRTHDRAYGYNPIEIWLNETIEYTSPDGTVNEYPANAWYSLGFQYGYSDHYTTYTDSQTGEEVSDWIWKDENGDIVAYTDLQFREDVFTDLMNRYNKEILDGLDSFGEIAPIIGADYYHYKNKFWLHAYANYILPFHKYVQGNVDVSYLNRNNYGAGGLKPESNPEQWEDYSAGLNLGWKINKNLGVFMGGEYSKMWDSEIFQSTVGLNITIK